MVAEDFRQSKRRACERRLDERRLVHFLFGSAKWRQNIEQQYLMWPRIDRRALDRRYEERRHLPRRQVLGSFKDSQRMVKQSNLRDILSHDEKAMLAGLFQSNESV